MSTPTVIVNHPDAAVFAPPFALSELMGTWHVVHSTLPMWRSKKDVSITYTPLAGAPARFADHVQYRARTAARTSTPTTIRGTDTATAAPTRFRWRGSGLLTPITSHWQVLALACAEGGPVDGAKGAQDPADDEQDTTHATAYAVTFFRRTLFTPAGLDIYARTPAGLPPAGLPPALLSALLARLQDADAVGADVARLAAGLFAVPRSDA